MIRLMSILFLLYAIIDALSAGVLWASGDRVTGGVLLVLALLCAMCASIWWGVKEDKK